MTSETLTFDHPQVGPIRLDRQKLAVSGHDGMMLVVYHAEPHTSDADELAILAR